MMNKPQDLVAFGKANVEAVTESGQILAAGLKELTEQFVARAKASYEESVANFKALSAVKTPAEAIELQKSIAQTAIANTVSESQKLTEASIRLTEKALAPLTARVSAAVESFSKVA